MIEYIKNHKKQLLIDLFAFCFYALVLTLFFSLISLYSFFFYFTISFIHHFESFHIIVNRKELDQLQDEITAIRKYKDESLLIPRYEKMTLVYLKYRALSFVCNKLRLLTIFLFVFAVLLTLIIQNNYLLLVISLILFLGFGYLSV